MSIKALLLDFDGTALQRDQVFISIRNMTAIKRALDKGVYVIPSTGRAVDMQPPQIEAEERIRYLITSGGSRVYDRRTGENIYTCTWTPAQSAELCRIFEGRNIYAEIAAEGHIYIEKHIADHLEDHHIPPHHTWYLLLGRQIPVEKPSEYFLSKNIGIEKINIYNIVPEEQHEMYDRFQNTGFAYITDPIAENMQAFQTGLDRRTGIRILLERLGISMDEIMCIGDNAIDEDSIVSAGIGVAMGNAPDWLKAKADYVAPPYDQDGVAAAIEKFIL